MSPAAWWWRAVDNAHKKHLRRYGAKKRSAKTVPVDNVTLDDRAPNPEQATLSREYLGQFYRCLKELKPKFYKTLLRKELDQSFDEIAKIMGTKEGTVKSRVHTAKNLVSECLKRNLQPDRWMSDMDMWDDHLKAALAEGLKDATLTAHLDERQLTALALGTFTEDQDQPLLEHLVICSVCSRYYTRIQTALREREQLLGRPRRPTWQSSWLALAAGVVLGLGLFKLLLVPPQSLQNPLRLELDATAPTRGLDALLLEGRDGLDLQLALPPSKAFTSYRLDLVQNGKVRERFEQVRLEGGTLSLILPVERVPKGRFELVAIGVDRDRETRLAVFSLELNQATR